MQTVIKTKAIRDLVATDPGYQKDGDGRFLRETSQDRSYDHRKAPSRQV